jgi:hypothetical protein
MGRPLRWVATLTRNDLGPGQNCSPGILDPYSGGPPFSQGITFLPVREFFGLLFRGFRQRCDLRGMGTYTAPKILGRRWVTPIPWALGDAPFWDDGREIVSRGNVSHPVRKAALQKFAPEYPLVSRARAETKFVRASLRRCSCPRSSDEQPRDAKDRETG